MEHQKRKIEMYTLLLLCIILSKDWPRLCKCLTTLTALRKHSSVTTLYRH